MQGRAFALARGFGFRLSSADPVTGPRLLFKVHV